MNSDPTYLRPRLIGAARDALRAVESVHPDVWTQKEHQEDLLRAAELLEAAALRLAASHHQMVDPGGGQDIELRNMADRLMKGRTIISTSTDRPSDKAPVASKGADAHSESPKARHGGSSAGHPGDHAAHGGAPGVLRRIGR